MSKHFKERQSQRMEHLIQQERAEARLECERLIIKHQGREVFEAFLHTEQPEYNDQTGQEILDNIPETILEKLVAGLTSNAFGEVRD
ncbi:MAG: hypothetical protein EAZ42_06570 [Verrucomicrobia bacterium]|nr:MAG: hypothetical protein EAZ42_06570 [Verrucomicrobiota bacterium]